MPVNITLAQQLQSLVTYVFSFCVFFFFYSTNGEKKGLWRSCIYTINNEDNKQKYTIKKQQQETKTHTIYTTEKRHRIRYVTSTKKKTNLETPDWWEVSYCIYKFQEKSSGKSDFEIRYRNNEWVHEDSNSFSCSEIHLHDD